MGTAFGVIFILKFLEFPLVKKDITLNLNMLSDEKLKTYFRKSCGVS
jgi:hypothetical protein